MAADNKTSGYPNPFLRANGLSKFFFWWLKDIIWYSQSHDLIAKDLYDTIPEDLSGPLRCDLESAWMKEVRAKNQKPSLWKVVAKVYLWDFIKYSVLLFFFTVIQIVQPQLLALIMSYFQPESTELTITSQRAYFNATIFIMANVLRTAFLFHGFFYLRRLGMRARLACSSLIYKKMMRLPFSANRKMNSSIMSLLSIDVANFELVCSCIPFIIFVPVQLLVVACLIWNSVGLIAAAVGVTLMIILTFPSQALHSKMTLKFRAKQTARTDNRVILIGEIVNGMRAVKLYVWEKYLEKLVYTARSLEIASYLKISYLTSVVWAVVSISHTLCAYALMLAYELRDGIITAEQILPVTQHLGNLEMSIGFFFFAGVKNTTDMCISMKRIEDFLLLEEVESKAANIDDSASEVISIRNMTVSLDDKSIIFNNISLNFFRKKLYLVSGPVGSGKSFLLKLILGELKSASGEVIVRGSISYASQEPWLFNGTVRDNILLGEDYSEIRYEQVVSVCALAEDFTQLPHGDKTLVGDRGSNLSGGQRARINLARAVYREADIYLLDDPLSAVDTRVAKHIMKECFNGMIRNKTRILVTRSIRQLNGVEKIVILENGRVEFRKDMESLQQKDQDAKQSTKVVNKIEKTSAIEKPEINDDKSNIGNNRESEETLELITKGAMKTSKVVKKIEETSAIEKPEINDDKSNIDNNRESEETLELIAKGAMKTSVYLTYVKSGGWGLAFLVILLNFAYVIATSAFNFGLGTWTKSGDNHTENETDNNRTMSVEGHSHQINSPSVEKSLFIFGGLMTLMIITSLMKNLCICRFALNVSENIHNLVFSRLLMAPMRFFEGNSTGQILNRFSEDTGILDKALPYSLFEAINTTFAIITAFLSAILANWWVLIPCIISLSMSLLIGKVVIPVMQKIKRFAGVAKSPILSFAASSLEGVSTIRSCRAEHIVTKDFDARQDCHTPSQFLTIALCEAFSLWTQLISVGLLASVTCLCVLLKNKNTGSEEKNQEGHVGLSLMQIFIMTGQIAGVVKRVAEVFAHMTSVERMLQFTELGQETAIENESGLELPSSWPSKGQIIFDHLYLRYFEDSNPVLWDVNCIIEAGSKVGIVGRTGAGKSSLTSALFRFAKTDGTIFIDGIDIKRVDLHRLRSKLSIIPQEPVLFRGSLRKNLDPLDKFDDATLWSALERVELKRIFNSLDFPIDRAGGNLSIGQRQLLCLARTVINRNKIIILDEATANIDSATDALIQKTIRSIFKECTVLTIAHRLETVMDNDKVLVMDNGRLIEYDSPFLLLQNNSSCLFKMAIQSGQIIHQNLMALAEQAYTFSSNKKY